MLTRTIVIIALVLIYAIMRCFLVSLSLSLSKSSLNHQYMC